MNRTFSIIMDVILYNISFTLEAARFLRDPTNYANQSDRHWILSEQVMSILGLAGFKNEGRDGYLTIGEIQERLNNLEVIVVNRIENVEYPFLRDMARRGWLYERISDEKFVVTTGGEKQMLSEWRLSAEGRRSRPKRQGDKRERHVF